MTTNRIATLFPDHGEPTVELFQPTRATKKFASGCRVRVRTGAMAGVEGKVLAYCSASRLIIAVDLDCQGVTLEVDEKVLAALDE